MRDAHARAENLILKARVEGNLEDEQRWLESHLAVCQACNARARATEKALVSLRRFSVPVRPELLASTRIRVLLRTRELGRKHESMRALWVCCGFSWLLGIASAPLVWDLFKWLGTEARMPALVWEAGFALWWFVPASIAAAIVIWQRSRGSNTTQNSDVPVP